MGTNAIVCGKSDIEFLTSGDPKVENIQSTYKALHVTDPTNLNNVGNFKWGSPTRERQFFYGKRAAVQNVVTTVWAGPTTMYVFPIVAQQMRLVSTSANDSAAGSGIRTVSIEYLDSNYIQHSEVVTLNGITPVLTTATNIFRINYFHAETTGTPLAGAAGTISLQNTTGTVTYDILTVGGNVTRTGVFTVPADHTLCITHWQAAAGTATGSHFTQLGFLANCHNGVATQLGTLLVQDESGLLNSATNINFPTPIPIPETVDILAVGISDAGGADAICMVSVMGYLERN